MQLYGKLAAPDNLSPSPNEAMVSSVLQHNVARLYTAVAVTWVPFGKSLLRLATWEDSGRSWAWAIVCLLKVTDTLAQSSDSELALFDLVVL